MSAAMGAAAAMERPGWVRNRDAKRRNAAGRARIGASKVRIGHTPFNFLIRGLPVSGISELNVRLTGKRV